LKVVLDTNVFLVCLSERSRLHWIFQELIAKSYTICVTTEILSEYAEIIGQHMGQEASEHAMATLENLSNIDYVTTYFRFRLIEKDHDDNKFSDCALSGNADYLVTHDQDFKVLKQIDFPKIQVIDTDEFKEILLGQKNSPLE